QELLDECERFLRDFAHAAQDLGAPRCIYVPAPDRDPGSSGLQPSQLGPALRLFDGQRTLADVVEESPFRVFDTLRVVKRLLDSGVLAVKSDGIGPGDPHSMLSDWAVVPDDQRGIVGERRRTSRRLKTVGGALPPSLAPAPRAAAAPIVAPSPPSAPIPLTHKKSTTFGEMTARKAPGTPAALAALAQAPTVQFKLDDLPPAAPMGPAGLPPITARHIATQPEPPVRRAPTPVPTRENNLRRTPPPDSLRRTPPPDGARRTPSPSLRDSGKRPSLDAMLPSGPDSKAKLRKILPATRLTPSTAFDAVEADFFAREADLYKHEKVESFDDLDRGKRPGGGKKR
ncbi:MAG TPA: hypothetical protein VLA14_17855, partial [Polyangia bacterium]|nr:hypothetical protein [Polyangia bacterium]